MFWRKFGFIIAGIIAIFAIGIVVIGLTTDKSSSSSSSVAKPTSAPQPSGQGAKFY